MQKVTKQLVLPATTTIEIRLDGGTYDRVTDIFFARVFSVLVSPSNSDFGVYEFDVTSALTTAFFESARSPVITKVELEYWYFQADTSPSIESVEFIQVLDQPSTDADSDLHDNIADPHAVVYATQSLHGSSKIFNSVNLGSNAVTAMQDAVDNETFFAVGTRRNQSLTGQGAVQIGGLVLHDGTGTAWEETAAGEIDGPPALVISYELNEEAHIDHEMRYTTSDPTTPQMTPANSLGGHASSNEVYSRSQIGDYISATQLSIPISTSGSLPSKTSGLAQMGPEILKYEGIDTINRQLINVTRGIVPSAFPASLDPHVENIYYLDVDQLFNTRPTSGQDQYRCVAVTHVTANRPAQNVKALLRQSSSADIQVDIGIEVPKHDTHTGAQYSTAASDGQILIDDTNFTTLSTGFFDGSHLVISGSDAIIESFDVDGVGLATFILDRNVGSVSSGTVFRINPAPSQVVITEVQSPVENSGRFFGFFEEEGSNEIGFNSIRESVDELQQHDLFYIWIKRTITANIKASDDTGAVILIQFTDATAS